MPPIPAIPIPQGASRELQVFAKQVAAAVSALNAAVPATAAPRAASAVSSSDAARIAALEAAVAELASQGFSHSFLLMGA